MTAATAFDPYAPDFLADPYPAYRRLRHEAPVFYDERWELTFFTCHRDVTSILKDRRRFGRDVRHRLEPGEIDADLFDRIYPPTYPTWTDLIRDSFIDLEPPRHTRLRRLVSKAFTRRASEEFRPRLAAQADEIVAVAVEREEMEVISDLATPIPLAMISDLMGIPVSDRAMLVAWSHAIVRLFDTNCSAAEGREAEEAVTAFAAYLEDLLDHRRRRPGDDLISSMIEVEDEGETLTDREIVATSILTLNAGHEATVHAIGNGILALARDPGAYAELRSNPSLVPTAVAELLRYDSPLQMFERWVLEDVDWEGVRLARGTKVGLLFGSANRDQEAFENPESLDLGRDPNPHVSFGGGIHYCVGAPLALVELEVVLAALARRVASLHVTGAEPDRLESLVFRGVNALSVAVSA